jgi:hypothetical protein
VSFEFTAVHHGESDKLGLCKLFEEFAADQWIGSHYSEDQASSLMFERFKLTLASQLELLEVFAERTTEAEY